MRRTLLGMAVMVLWGTVGAAVVRAEEPQGGTLTGILTAKGEAWIEVKADGAEAAVRYVPFWRGGNPADGGGYDKEMLQTIKRLVVPNRVKLTWEFQERPRIFRVEILKPEGTEGTLVGILKAKGETWIEVQPTDGVPGRFWPRWIGNAGGGFDRDILRAFAALKVGDKVSVRWTYDERLRALSVAVVP